MLCAEQLCCRLEVGIQHAAEISRQHVVLVMGISELPLQLTQNSRGFPSQLAGALFRHQGAVRRHGELRLDGAPLRGGLSLSVPQTIAARGTAGSAPAS